MDVKAFQFDAALGREFARCGAPSTRAAVETMLSPDFPFHAARENRHRHFVAQTDGRTVGRMTAAVHAGLQRSVGQRVGTLGLYECDADADVAAALLDAGLGWLREQDVDRVWGPMNFDIWHGYRFLMEGFGRDRFLGEPDNPPHHPAQFERHGFRPVRWWTSAEFEGAAAVRRLIARFAPLHRRFLDRGFTFRTADPDHLDDALRRAAAILSDAFARFPGFTPIAERDFLARLAPARPALRPELIVFLDDPRGRSLACTISVADAADRAVLYMGGKIRGADGIEGIGAGLFFHAVQTIVDGGFSRLIVALMEEGNMFDRICRSAGPAASRRYALLEWRP